MPAIHSKILATAISVAVLLQCILLLSDLDDAQPDEIEEWLPFIMNVHLRKVFNDVYSTVWFKHHAWVNEKTFDMNVDATAFNNAEASKLCFE